MPPPPQGLFTKRDWGCHCTVCSVPVTPGQEGSCAECPGGLRTIWGSGGLAAPGDAWHRWPPILLLGASPRALDEPSWLT